ncbi:DNA-formamidopyrimidine glycosylase [Candidatus Saccharibacteria bacterium]|nr:MAG: DNA-formamidopyrimidine glycosylase [Candidatus Saccharibacteria bacterium]
MPELPEVETVRLGLNNLIVGKTFKTVSHDAKSMPGWHVSYSADTRGSSAPHFVRQRTSGMLPHEDEAFADPVSLLATEKVNLAHSKSFPNAPADVSAFLIGASVTAVKRRAKVLLIELSSHYSLVIHLKMTGQMVFIGKPEKQNVERRTKNEEGRPSSALDVLRSGSNEVRFGAGHPNDSLVNALPDKSTRVEFAFTDGSKLFFNDQRKFGWVKLIPTVEVPNIDFMRKVGPEPLDASFTAKQFIERLQRRKNTNIKAALLDQTVIAGVGNIYADESLWGAKIHPTTLVKDVSTQKLSTLFTELQYVLNLSIEKGGSSNHTYVNAEGRKGSYMNFARVFRRESLECPRCGTTIIKLRVAGRGTHICPHCQKV